jgi:excisionase family DNA binding protein
MDSPLLTIKEVAARLQLSEKAVGKLVQTGDLAGTKVAGHWSFKPEAVADWQARRANAPVAAQTLPASVTGVPEALSLIGALNPLRMNLNLMATDRDGVLRELAMLIVPPSEKRFLNALVKALKAREELCSTCVSEGVAIPHSRNALIGLVERAVIGYGRHAAGLDFGALDGKPVRHFFLLCAPNVREHLQLLARLARVLRQPGFSERLDAAGTPQDVVAVIQQAEERR